MREDGVAFALRNPDLYLAGVRVDMVSSEEAFAAQIPGFTEADVAKVAFFAEWLTVPDRVGWWVRHPEPPGDDAAAVAARIRTFAGSLADREDDTAFTVAVTHSPVLRACALDVAGGDIGEPHWLAGLEAEIGTDRSVTPAAAARGALTATRRSFRTTRARRAADPAARRALVRPGPGRHRRTLLTGRDRESIIGVYRSAPTRRQHPLHR